MSVTRLACSALLLSVAAATNATASGGDSPLAEGASWSCVSAPVVLHITALPTDPAAPTAAEFEMTLNTGASFTASGVRGESETPFSWSGSWINLDEQLLLIGQFDSGGIAHEMRGTSAFVNTKGLRLVVDLEDGEAIRATCRANGLASIPTPGVEGG